MRAFQLAFVATAAAAAALLTSAPAHAAAMKIAIDEPCPPGYNEHAAVTVEGRTVRFCSIP